MRLSIDKEVVLIMGCGPKLFKEETEDRSGMKDKQAIGGMEGLGRRR